MSAETIALLTIPILVFLARILDVSIGTLRIIFVSKGFKSYAALLGFIESLVWVLAITQVMQHMDNWITYIAFAFGFSVGNYVGIMIEERIAVGSQILRVITRHDATELLRHLRAEGYGVTSVDATGDSGPVKVIFTVARRRKLEKIIRTIKQFNPNAFYTIEDVRFVKETFIPQIASRPFVPFRSMRMRK
ncbi:MAG: hypothetical protein C0623_12040 [Desulfuromonas sp.]|nr:MAG: hypothetical protein C0623_12040 [Desulfuromonas sp.]